MKYRRKPVEVEAQRVTMVDGFQTWLVDGPRGRTFVDLRDFERDYEPIEPTPSHTCASCPACAVNLADARLAGFHAGRDWMKQGREYVEGWRDGIKRAFAFLKEPNDERVKVLFREQPYSWERQVASSSPPSEDTNAQ